MSSVLNKKLRRDILNSKGMLIAVVAIIAVGVSFLVGMYGTFNNLTNAKTSYYSKCNIADFWIELKKAPNSTIEKITAINGVSSVRERILFPIVVDLEGVETPLSGTVISMPQERAKVINDIVMLKGTYFTEDKKNEVIVSKEFAKKRNIVPGSFIHLIMNGQRKKLFVVGVGISSEYVYMVPPGSIVPNPAEYGVFWIKQDYAEDTFGFSGAYNNLVGLLSPEAQKHPEFILEEITDKLKPYGVFTNYDLKNQPSNMELVAELGGLRIFAILLPILFLGVAALILNVVMLRTTEQQRVIIGTLKALGVSNREIFWFFIKYSLTVGITGGVIGCFLGYWFAAFMTNLYQKFYTFPELNNLFYPSIMLIALVISIIFAILGSLRGVKGMVKLNPAEAMHPPPPQTGGKILFERWIWLWSRLDFRWQIVLRSIFRNKGRTIIGVLCAAMGAALVFMALAMSDSIGYMVSFQFNNVIHSDYTLNIRDEVNYGALYEVKRLPGITHAEPELIVPCNFINGPYHKKGVITGLIENPKLITPCNINGVQVKIPSTGLLMNERLAKILHLKVGDMVEFIPVKGLKQTHKVPIANIINSTFGLSVYADFKYLNHLISEESAISVIQLKGTQTRQQKRALLTQVKKYPKLASLSDIKNDEKLMKTSFVQNMNTMVYTMIIFAAVIFLGSILNSSLISISERQMEIATFRVLGYSPIEIGKIFLRETLIVNITGAVIGIPFGYLLNYWTSLMYQNNMFSMPCYVTFSSYVWTMVLALIFIFIAYIITQRTINRMNWLDSLNVKA